MPELIESLESRTLFTATAMVIAHDVADLKAQGVTARADLNAALKVVASDVRGVRLAVAAVHTTPAQRKPLYAFERGEALAAIKYRARISTLLAEGFIDGARLDALLAIYKLHPTSTIIQARVGKALTALQNVFSTQTVTAVETNAGATVTAIDTNLNAVVAAVPSAQTASVKMQGDLNLDLGTLSSQASLIQGDISILANDLA